jgi:signal transduction histidine kinase
MRKSRRSHSLQVRVLALVGAGVFIAGALLSFLSRSTLLALEREVAHDHQRLAASLARDLSRAVANDMRLLARAATAPPAGVPAALAQVRDYGRLSTSAFTVDDAGTVVTCWPVFECLGLEEGIRVAALAAARTQRTSIGNAVRASDGRVRFIGIMPFRHVEGHAASAAGISIDAGDRRLHELLTATDVAATLRLRLRDGAGVAITPPGLDPADAPVAAAATVIGTPWQLDLVDVDAHPLQPLAAYRRNALWLAPTLTAFAMLLGWGIARSVRQPLIELTAAAERIARGAFDPPLDLRRAAAAGEEVGRLGAALERMRSELLASFERIERANEELEWRVGERTQQLAAANLRLEERERVRQKLLRQVISAQEEERKRVARELHDETSQTLTALGIDVDLALDGSDGPVRQRLLAVRRHVDRMHQELHRMIVNLRPSVLDDLGLAAGIRWLANHHLARAGIAVRCELDGLDERLPPEVETAIFRVVQEALANVARHAKAESVLIQATIEDGSLEVAIEDDGTGFDAAALEWSPESLRGAGLLGMRERIDILGGSIRVDSTPGAGTGLFFSVPVRGAEIPVTGVM